VVHVQDFRQLSVWRKAHQLVLSTYTATSALPGHERFELRSQMRRAAVSVASNIAKGCGRGSDADFARFLLHATGSTAELEYQVILSRDLGYLDEPSCLLLQAQAEEVRKMLAALIVRLRSLPHVPERPRSVDRGSADNAKR
jgi:four helix bundle protein